MSGGAHATSRAGLVARRMLFVFAAYYAGARLGLAIPYVGTQITLLWLPTGVAVAALFRWGGRMALPVFAGSLLVNGLAPIPGWCALLIASGNTAGPWLAARLMRSGGFDRRMARHTDIVLFLWTGAAGMLVTATVGSASLAQAHAIGNASVGAAWLSWWIGDTVGVVLAGVPLMAFSRAAMRAPARRANAGFETFALLVGVLVISLAAFARELPLDSALMFPLLSVPFVLMSMLALRHGILLSSIAVLALAMLAVAGTAAGLGPFGDRAASGGLLALWGYIVALACTTMMICALAGELASSQKRMLALFAHAHDGLLLVDDGGRIVQANPAAAVLLGAEALALRGQPLWQFEVGAGHAGESALLRLVQRLGAPAIAPVHAGRLRRADGREFDGECQVATYTDSGGMTQAHVVVRDVTARLRAEADRLAADAAVRANRAKTEFLSRMSHELRTPLNAVLGFAQLLQRDAVRLPAEQRGNVGHILHAGTHLLSLIDEVLDLSRIEAGGVELSLVPVALDDVLAGALIVVQPGAAARGVALERGPSRGDAAPRVLADAMRLHQVLVNLLDNAVKYTPAGGRVWLQWQLLVDDLGRDAVAIEVGDTGAGLSDDQLGHLFEPFNRLGAERSAIEGTGIGLVISRRFVELMDGRMQVESRPGIGSVFRVVLPAADASSTPAAAAPPADAVTSGASEEADPPAPHARSAADALADGRQRVLYVEDNEVNLLLVEGVLRPRRNLALATAATGQAGLARARSDPPDLVLIDMQLPDMSGMELFRLLRRAPELRGVACVAVSADAMPESIEQALAEGFSDYLTKPLRLDLFNACIDRHLRRD